MTSVGPRFTQHAAIDMTIQDLWCVTLCQSVEITNNMHLVIEFIIQKFIEGSTCFERHTAHHQELQTVFAASSLYSHMVTGRCPG